MLQKFTLIWFRRISSLIKCRSGYLVKYPYMSRSWRTLAPLHAVYKTAHYISEPYRMIQASLPFIRFVTQFAKIFLPVCGIAQQNPAEQCFCTLLDSQDQNKPKRIQYLFTTNFYVRAHFLPNVSKQLLATNILCRITVVD